MAIGIHQKTVTVNEGLRNACGSKPCVYLMNVFLMISFPERDSHRGLLQRLQRENQRSQGRHSSSHQDQREGNVTANSERPISHSRDVSGAS